MTQWMLTETPLARPFRYEPERVESLKTRHPYDRRLAEARLKQMRYS